jgi:hypothetical protein
MSNMSDKRNRSRILLATVIAAATLASAYAVDSYLSSFRSTYPAAAGTRLDSCSLCHKDINASSARNAYGSAYAGAGHNFKSIESLDSDGDGFTNIEEIKALKFPGNASDTPPLSDTTAPTVTAFAIPATASSLTVSITTLTATDAVGVTGYLVNESSTKPAASASGWTASKPTSYTFVSEGAKTLYAFAKDAANNVSNSMSDSTTITLPPAPDTTAPTVTGFAIPATATSLTVSITTLTATDAVGVTGYLVNESSTKPAASASGWTASKPASYTFGSAGAKTLYAWAKDAANNVSNSLNASTTITLPPAPDTTAPTVTGFAIPATATSLTVSITTLTATDAVGVTGYLVNESSTKPAASASGWTASKPASYTFGSAGAKTLYAWAKDAANNVSNSLNASTTITLPPAPDTTAPTVTGFAIPATATSLTVSITTLTATDAVGVTGYLVNESSTKPAASASGWTASKPTSYTFGSAGAKTLYAWAKDAANNVSNSLNASTTITLPPVPDTTAPTITAFTIPATSTSLTVSITSIVASDNVGITGYLLTESSTKPTATGAGSGAGWTASSPSSHTFGSAGAKTLYAWAKDAANNVSNSMSASTTITITPTGDTVAPTITSFTLPPTSTSLTVPITSFSASDNVATTGYLVTESSAKPGADGAGWKGSAPASYAFGTAGSKMLYGWAKDAAGNISNAKSAATTITTPDDSSTDLSVYAGTWFKVRINRDAGKESWKESDDSGDKSSGTGESGEIAYLKIQSWNETSSVLDAAIYFQNGKKGPWTSAPLPFNYTSGDPGRFLFWFEYAGEYQFAAGMIAKIDGNLVVRARFNAAGIYLYKTEEEMSADVNLALTIVAGLVSESNVPLEVLGLASAQTN